MGARQNDAMVETNPASNCYWKSSKTSSTGRQAIGEGQAKKKHETGRAQ